VGLAFADGLAVTLWTDPHPGFGVTVSGSVQTLGQRYALVSMLSRLAGPGVDDSAGHQRHHRIIERKDAANMVSHGAFHDEDPLYPAAWQFPLGRPFHEVTLHADPPSDPGKRPFGLRFARDRPADVQIDRTKIGYDGDRQIGVVHEADRVLPLWRHTDGVTNTQTSDGHRGMDTDTDHRED
jgi:putative ATP-grasp target RiPP